MTKSSNLGKRIAAAESRTGGRKRSYRLQDGDPNIIYMSIEQIMKIGIGDALNLKYLIEFNEEKPEDFDEILDRVRLIAGIDDKECTPGEKELAMCINNCREALAAKVMSIEEQRDIERSFYFDEKAIQELEAAGLLDWQKRERREQERANLPRIQITQNVGDVL